MAYKVFVLLTPFIYLEHGSSLDPVGQETIVPPRAFTSS